MDEPGVCTSERLRPNVCVRVSICTTLDKILYWLSKIRDLNDKMFRMLFSFILYYALCYQLHSYYIGVLGLFVYFPAERSSSSLPVFFSFSPYIYVGPTGGT